MVAAVRLWPRSEKRSTADYTEVAISAIEQYAAGSVASPQALAAVEAAASMCESAFAAARAVPDLPVVGPHFLGMMGRAYALRGEAVFMIGVDADGLALIPCSSWEVAGPADPRGWRYRLDLGTPGGAMSRVLPAEGVVHVRWHCDPARPWAGRSPLKIARLSAEVAAAAETSMKNEFAIRPTRIIPTPGGNAEQVAETAAKFRQGGVRGVAWARQLADNMRADPKPEIMGPAPTSGTVDVRRSAAVEVATALGIPPPLIDAQAAGQGQREAYRRFALLTIAPALRIAAAEIAAKLDRPGLRLDTQALGAIDLISRARAVQVLVAAGFETEAAARAAGVLNLPDGEA